MFLDVAVSNPTHVHGVTANLTRSNLVKKQETMSQQRVQRGNRISCRKLRAYQTKRTYDINAKMS